MKIEIETTDVYAGWNRQVECRVIYINTDLPSLFDNDVAAAVHYLKAACVESSSMTYIPTSVPEDEWLYGEYSHPHLNRTTEVKVHIRECDDIKRAVIFRELCPLPIAA